LERSSASPNGRHKNKKAKERVPSMNIFKYAKRIKPSIASVLDRTLETIAHVLCVQSHGVMVCGASAASVAHFANPHFSRQPASSSHGHTL
jgi:hypothetical protein